MTRGVDQKHPHLGYVAGTWEGRFPKEELPRSCPGPPQTSGRSWKQGYWLRVAQGPEAERLAKLQRDFLERQKSKETCEEWKGNLLFPAGIY